MSSDPTSGLTPTDIIAELARICGMLEAKPVIMLGQRERDDLWAIEIRFMQLRHKASNAEMAALVAKARRGISADVRKILDTPDSELALEGAIDNMLASGDLDLPKNPPMDRLIAETMRTGRVPNRIPPAEEMDAEDDEPTPAYHDMHCASMNKNRRCDCGRDQHDRTTNATKERMGQ